MSIPSGHGDFTQKARIAYGYVEGKDTGIGIAILVVLFLLIIPFIILRLLCETNWKSASCIWSSVCVIALLSGVWLLVAAILNLI